MPTKTGSSKQVTVRFPDDQYDVLCAILKSDQQLARAKGSETDLSKVVRELVVTNPKYLRHAKGK